MNKEIEELLEAHRAWLGITVFASAGAVFLVTERLRRAKEALAVMLTAKGVEDGHA